MTEISESNWLAKTQTGITGIDFLDECLPRSQPPNTVYGLLGPIGVGKSTLGAMITVEGAKAAYARCQTGDPPGVWVYINLEGKKIHVQDRLLSHGAMISRNRPKRGSIQENHSANNNNHSYELERSAELPSRDGVLLGECVRFQEFVAKLWNQHVCIVHLGSVYLPQNIPPVQALSDRLEQIARHRRITGVVIDYVGIAVSQIVGFDSPHWRLSTEIRRFVSESREQIAERWGCPVWLIHQLNGVANQHRPGVVQHHNDASECRRFGENLDVCFTLGTSDRQTGAFQIACTKSRTEPPGPTILQFDPDFATLREAKNLRVEQTTGTIVTTDTPIYIDPTLLDLLED